MAAPNFIIPQPSERPGRSAADDALDGKAGHLKGLRQFSRQVRNASKSARPAFVAALVR